MQINIKQNTSKTYVIFLKSKLFFKKLILNIKNIRINIVGL